MQFSSRVTLWFGRVAALQTSLLRGQATGELGGVMETAEKLKAEIEAHLDLLRLQSRGGSASPPGRREGEAACKKLLQHIEEVQQAVRRHGQSS